MSEFAGPKVVIPHTEREGVCFYDFDAEGVTPEMIISHLIEENYNVIPDLLGLMGKRSELEDLYVPIDHIAASAALALGYCIASIKHFSNGQIDDGKEMLENFARNASLCDRTLACLKEDLESAETDSEEASVDTEFCGDIEEACMSFRSIQIELELFLYDQSKVERLKEAVVHLNPAMRALDRATSRIDDYLEEQE